MHGAGEAGTGFIFKVTRRGYLVCLACLDGAKHGWKWEGHCEHYAERDVKD